MPRVPSLPAGFIGSLLLACTLAPAAHADLPPVSNSTSPAFIRVVGSTAGVPDTVAGNFSVVVRDLANDPVPNAQVTVDLSRCADMRMATDQLNPNYTVNCAGRLVSAYTNAAGIATLTILGSSWSGGSYSGLGCARIYADGVLLSTPTVAAFDLDGTGGVTVGDLSVWMADLGAHVYRGRDDYDGNGTVSVGDLSVWLAELGAHRSNVTGSSCP